MTVVNNVAVSNICKFKSMGLFINQPTITQNGMTKSAICVDEPTATPNEISILLFMANITAEACSAAFPTMGNKITEMKATEKSQDADAPSIVETK